MVKNRRISFIILITLSFSWNQTQAQENYIRWVLDTLASPHLSGRGYVDSGLQKAALVIEDEFKKWGIQPFGQNFRQSFQHDVVVFDGLAELQINQTVLKAGADFLVSPGSRAIKAKNRVPERLDSIRWIDPANRVVLEVVDKLTWGVATVQDDYTVVYVLKSSMPSTIQSYSIQLNAKRIKDFTSENILGWVAGNERPDSFLVLTAHYDHLGKLGPEATFCGANDNASGVALMLDIARQIATGEKGMRYSVMFIAFAGEEAGLLGSAHYVKNPLFPLEKIRFLVNLDLLGTGEDGIMVVNATEYPNEWQILDSLNKTNAWLKSISQRGKARNSDHYWFTEAGVPAFFIYTLGGIAAYHDIYDVRETLPLTKTKEVGELIINFFETLNTGN